jgi:hypothetical protein
MVATLPWWTMSLVIAANQRPLQYSLCLMNPARKPVLRQHAEGLRGLDASVSDLALNVPIEILGVNDQ